MSSAPFIFVVGVVVGVLLVGLVAPRRHTVTVAGTGAPGAGSTTETGGAVTGGSASGVAGSDAALGTTGGATSTGARTASGTAGGSVSSGGSSSGAAGASGTGSRAPGSTIVVGIAYPDLTALRVLGPEYDNGNVPAQWDAVLDKWRRDKTVPINGHPVQFVYDKYNVLNLDDQRRSCAVLTDDKHSFVVVGVAYFAIGVECAAAEKKVPTLTTDGPLDDVYQRGRTLFSMQMSESRLLRNWIIWAEKRGFVHGHRLGIYYENDDPSQKIEYNIVKQALAALNPFETLASEATTRHADANGGPEDAIAARKFQSDNVDIALLMTSKGGFMQQANAITYKPKYIESDHLFGTSDVATAVYPADQFHGTYGFTGRRTGEPAGHIPEPPGLEECLKNYERYTGQKLARTTDAGHETAEYGYILYACDLSSVMLRGLQAAGASLTADGFVGALESIRDMSMTRYPNISFGRGKHSGVDLQRTVLWDRSCTCWHALGNFEPLYGP